MAIHNLLKAWEFHNRAVLQYQRTLMAQQMMNKPVLPRTKMRGFPYRSEPLSKVIIVARHREQRPDLRAKCRRGKRWNDDSKRFRTRWCLHDDQSLGSQVAPDH
jgi:hypothetical protein